MFKWYQEAEVCYTYLRDVDSAANREAKLETFAKIEGHGRWSEWFERGWTLQELLAPRNMVFSDANWQDMGTRAALAEQIESVTGIQAKYLDSSRAFRSASVARRLSWQSHRQTAKVEEIAYSLIGVLGVALIPIYGEGSQAFVRLQEAFLSRYPDESLFAWTAPADGLPLHTQQWKRGEWGLLAPSVSCFRESGDVILDPTAQLRGAGEIARAPGGIKLPVLYQDLWPQRFQWLKLFFLIPPLSYFIWPCVWSIEHETQDVFTLTLNCYRCNEETSQLHNVQVNISRNGNDDDLWRRCQCWQLQLRRKRPDTGPRSGWPWHIDITVLQPEMLP